MNKIEIENNRNNEFFIKLYAKKIRESNFSQRIKEQHTNFINSQIEIANNFYRNLAKENKYEKIMKLTGLSLNQSKRIFK